MQIKVCKLPFEKRILAVIGEQVREHWKFSISCFLYALSDYRLQFGEITNENGLKLEELHGFLVQSSAWASVNNDIVRTFVRGNFF